MRLGVTGVPGTGKTVVARELSKRLKLEYFNVEDIIISQKLYREYDVERESYVIDVDRSIKWFEENNRNNAVYEGLALAYIATKKWIDKIIILRCNPYILEERLRRKGFSYSKIRENIASEILDIIPSEVYKNFGNSNTVQIDNSGDFKVTLEKALKFVRDDIAENDYVDWLSLVAGKGDLNKYLG